MASFPSMDDTYESMAKTITALLSRNNGSQIIVGIAGPPGAGKTTTAAEVSKRISGSIVVPMDGFHFSKAELDQFDNPSEAYDRRGSHWTFNASLFVSKLRFLKEHQECSFPSFDHGVGDPVENDIQVCHSHKVVIIEGNYLCLDIPPWDEVRPILDYIFFIDVELKVAEDRVYKRHMSLGYGEEKSRTRVTKNDSPNAVLILQSKHRSDHIVQSL